eukprot:GHRR01030969.1.p1 GENE.GHRR01030969.1~~GHRR01030969.1.p1  ORF type:complete len:313 (+),score=62.62 GHRR01030969.1:373-1311(+)
MPAAMYREDNVVQVALKPSPSLVYNNLCALESGLAYVHTRSGASIPAIPQQDSDKVTVKRIDTQGHSLVHSVRSCNVEGSCLLALGNEAGLQVWDQAGVNLLYFWNLPKGEPPSTYHADFVRGISFNVSQDGHTQLCAGCSNGDIQVFSVGAGGLLKSVTCLKHHKCTITALGSSYQSRRGIWSDDLGCELVSCDDQGNICVWEATSADKYTCLRIIEGGVPCSSLAVRKGFIIAGRTDGCVRIYRLVSPDSGHCSLLQMLSATLIHQRQSLASRREMAHYTVRLSLTAVGYLPWTYTQTGMSLQQQQKTAR